MNNRIHFFSQIDVIPAKVPSGEMPGRLLGLRGRQANEFAELGFPILPGFIIDAALASEIGKADEKDIKKI